MAGACVTPRQCSTRQKQSQPLSPQPSSSLFDGASPRGRPGPLSSGQRAEWSRPCGACLPPPSRPLPQGVTPIAGWLLGKVARRSAPPGALCLPGAFAPPSHAGPPNTVQRGGDPALPATRKLDGP
ncbi:hypothetical protein BAUCODRAFT_152867 [Baudoinia panamericana UAMH 10762]|uniref:Uncharacterized protein n=1 Tax=Baudoinia panamericana (strain UAMH 10762) TaxID=717646 RepID=M2MHS3_BAUPA|nr:uncharacterized protein BAUCODRAFT_152867 [Baudoinia panamericana UAMH 10762]EMC90808.1 hypothetical protein BAUCODRAFT_152867 [Baudoinia panamericana UAMH 10762]